MYGEINTVFVNKCNPCETINFRTVVDTFFFQVTYIVAIKDILVIGT